METSVAEPLIGRVLDNRYRVEALIARGGMATVFRGLDTRLDRTVAIKVMHPAFAANDEFVERFIREAKSAAKLRHPNIVDVYDQGTDGEHVFLVMEYVAGRTLRDVLRERGRLSPAEALAVTEEVVAALAVAHGAGIVHRDIKPENVLLGTDGYVRVADFGLARAVATSTLTATTGLLMGTAAYIAPEQVMRGEADARTDVYATGVLLYELLTGEPPFTGDSPLTVAYRHVHEDVPAPSTRIAGLNADIDALVRKATARDPDQRPAHARALLDEIKEVRGSLPERVDVADLAGVLALGRDDDTVVIYRTQETTVTPLPTKHERRRRPGFIALAAITVTAVLAGLMGWWLAQPAQVKAPQLVGLSESRALRALYAKHLKVRVGPRVHSDTVAAGLVAAQAPGANHNVAKGGTVTIDLSSGPLLVKVPTVTGFTVGDATSALRKAGFPVAPKPIYRYDSTVPANSVINTSPPGGQSIKHNSTVTLIVSQGVQTLPVPDERNQPKDQAVAALKAAGFQPQVTEAFNESVPTGLVVSQTPDGGTAPKGSTVALVVSKGPQLVTVPDLTGKKEAEAKAILQGLGLKWSISRFPGGPDKVLNQNPPGGTKVRKGAVILLYVF